MRITAIQPPAVAPKPDSDRVTLESSYHTHAIADLNSVTDSYKLMAHNIAQKPYCNLENELDQMHVGIPPLLVREFRVPIQIPWQVFPKQILQVEFKTRNTLRCFHPQFSIST
jgi:hypothetical protein